MNRRFLALAISLVLVLWVGGGWAFHAASAVPVVSSPPSRIALAADNPSPPADPVKLIFIHHSCGQNWLADGNGGLGIALRDNNYFVSDTNYDWGPGNIGSNTDIGHWWEWFRGTNSSDYMNDLYAESDKNCTYSRLSTDPGGENEVIMFKSCYPNSNLGGNADDPPTISDNPLRGQSCGSANHTVANAKGIYNDILSYFSTRQDKLFVVITAPPVQDSTYAANARAFNRWLVEQWLAEYPYDNVAVFDFYNTLTSNGGNWHTNDLGSPTGNHHRYRGGIIEYITDQGGDVAAYPDEDTDNHPSAAGNQKATGEFVELLNVFYHRRIETGTATPFPTNTPTNTPTATATPTGEDETWLASGWNLISIPISPASTIITDVLSSINGQYDLVYAYDASDAADPWKKYNTAAPSFLNDLTDIDETMGLWIRATEPVTLTVSGSVPSSTEISLYTGWNLVGYPSQTTRPITEALAGIEGKHDLVYAYDAWDAEDPWKKYNTAAPPFLNDLTEMGPGWGYWIRVSEDCVWSVP